MPRYETRAEKLTRQAEILTAHAARIGADTPAGQRCLGRARAISAEAVEAATLTKGATNAAQPKKPGKKPKKPSKPEPQPQPDTPPAGA